MLFGSADYMARRTGMCSFELYIISIYHLKQQNLRAAGNTVLFLHLPVFKKKKKSILPEVLPSIPPWESSQHYPLLTFSKVKMKIDGAA